ncbi:MAG: endopeptidase La [Firmicutes bacterium]|nr:endopeptidase La [Bacillota bacterium]
MQKEIVRMSTFITPDFVFFPGCEYPLTLHVAEQVDLFEDMAKRDARFMVVWAPKVREGDELDMKTLVKIGTVCSLRNFVRVKDGAATVTVVTHHRARTQGFRRAKSAIEARDVNEIIDPEMSPRESDLARRLVDTIRAKMKEISRMDKRMSIIIKDKMRVARDDYASFCDTVADFFLSKVESRARMIYEEDVCKRLDMLGGYIDKEFEHMQIAKDIGERTRKNLDQTQREYYLREQMRVIGKELGEDDDEAELREKLEACGAPDEVVKKVSKDISRISKINPMSPEIGIVRNWVDTILELPWNRRSEDTVDLKHARAVLDADHYNMTDVKDRIIEHLAVMKLTEPKNGEGNTNADRGGSPPGQILCFVGPPGVGKTSIAESVARALGRTFVRASLGGVRDESEIRGHRRTYVGALPGKIIAGMRKAGTVNPVFLLDEIDKMAHDYRGDPASAMLEVLDPVQNKSFSDHYLDVPYDLSQVLFICTANDESEIPWALEDRMEIIRLSSYTILEKAKIARQFLVPRLCREHGVDEKLLEFTEDGLMTIIESYTSEAGVRELARVLSSLIRKLAVKIVNGDGAAKKTKFDKKTVTEMLGAEKYLADELMKSDRVGVVNALSYSDVGGDVMQLEVVLLPGKGEMVMTGRLGEVMKESAQIALSVTKSLAAEYKIDEKKFTEMDVHIHAPSGSIPKEGPSAGCALVVGLVSAFCGRAVRGDMSITGEITLSGRVLEVGGIREKALGAYKHGIGHVILPTRNKKSMEKVPEEVRAATEFSFMADINAVLKKMILPASKASFVGN